MKRILIVNNNMHIGGVQKALLNLLQTLHRRHVKVVLLQTEAARKRRARRLVDEPRGARRYAHAAAGAQHHLAADAHVQDLPLIQRHDRKARRRAAGGVSARRAVLLLEGLRLALHLLGELTRERLFARGGLLVHLGEDLRQEFFV